MTRKRHHRNTWPHCVAIFAPSALFAATLSGCVGTTGGDVVDFRAAAAGFADKAEFTNDRGWHVVLTTARLHVGAVYLDGARPVSGAQSTACILPGTYVAEVNVGRDVDLLSSEPQSFPALGHGTTLDARAGQVWLTGGDVDEIEDETPILDIEGTADRAGDARPFRGTIHISSNRADTTSQLAGADPICRQRIVSPIPVSLTVEPAGGLLLRVDPTFLFVNVEFGDLTAESGVYAFIDDPATADQPSVNLYANLRAARGPTRFGTLYDFSWDPKL